MILSAEQQKKIHGGTCVCGEMAWSFGDFRGADREIECFECNRVFLFKHGDDEGKIELLRASAVEESQPPETAAWRCPKCDKRIELGEEAWRGFGNASSPAICHDCGTELEAS